jgi:hypothetical protein
MSLDCLFVEFICRPLLDCYSILRTFPEAISKPVAEILPHQPGLAVDYLNRTLGAARNANSASVAFVLVDPYYFPHFFCHSFTLSGFD